MSVNVNPVDSTKVQIVSKNNLEEPVEEIKVFPTTDEVADAGLGIIAIHMRAAKYKKEDNLPFGFSALSDGYALAKGTAEQIEYNSEKVTNTLENQKDEKFLPRFLKMLFGD